MKGVIDMVDEWTGKWKEEKGYFAIKDKRKYPDNLMIFIPDVAEYVFANGGLSEFDYEP